MRNGFKKYRRTQIAEMRIVEQSDIDSYIENSGSLIVRIRPMDNSVFMDNSHLTTVSISVEDLASGSPKIGDMIARNPKNHNDQWLVAEQYFKDNFEDFKQQA